MAKLVLLDAVLTIDANPLTQWCAKVELDDVFEEKDATNFASGGAKEVLGGLESGTIGITFKNDHAAGALDAIMWPLRRQVVAWTARADGGSISTSNPQYSGFLLVNQWKPIAGNVGDLNEFDVSFPMSGVMARATST